jgi:hypothetical protein
MSGPGNVFLRMSIIQVGTVLSLLKHEEASLAVTKLTYICEVLSLNVSQSTVVFLSLLNSGIASRNRAQRLPSTSLLIHH